MKFSTKTAAIALTLMVIVVLIIRDRINGLPLAVQPYSQNVFDQARAQRQPVLLFLFAKWSVQTYQPYWMIRQSRVLKSTCYSNDVRVLYLDVTDDTPDVKRVRSTFGLNVFPSALIFCADSDMPEVFTGWLSDEQIAQTLTACKP